MDESCRASEAERPSLIVDPRPFERAGALLAAALTTVLGEKDSVRLAIPGGSALEAACEARRLVARAWRRIHLTWVDERCVPVADAASNRGDAVRRGLLATGQGGAEEPGPARVLALYQDGETPEEALRRVRRTWRDDFGQGLDVALLVGAEVARDGFQLTDALAHDAEQLGLQFGHVTRHP